MVVSNSFPIIAQEERKAFIRHWAIKCRCNSCMTMFNENKPRKMPESITFSMRFIVREGEGK